MKMLKQRAINIASAVIALVAFTGVVDRPSLAQPTNQPYGEPENGLELGIASEAPSAVSGQIPFVPIVVTVKNVGSPPVDIMSLFDFHPIVFDSSGVQAPETYRCDYSAAYQPGSPPPPLTMGTVRVARFNLWCVAKIVRGKTYSVTLEEDVHAVDYHNKPPLAKLRSNTIRVVVPSDGAASLMPRIGHLTAVVARRSAG